MQRICVFCGSAPGKQVVYRQAAIALGILLAQRQYGLVYGGGHVGLMGILADATLQAGGEVIGVIPEPMVSRELAHHGVTQLHIVSSMHERKALMADLSDAFIALPGGYGTLEELFEVITWGKIGIHTKPIALLNVAHYFTPLLNFLDYATTEGFTGSAPGDFLVIAEQPALLLDALEHHTPPPTRPWLTTKQA